MQWEVTHQTRDESSPAEQVMIDADTSGNARQIMRDQLPKGHLILHVRRTRYDGIDQMD
jgi:hypothetical protein